MSPALPVVTGKQCARALQRAGFYVDHSTGSHARLYHRTKPELRVAVNTTNKDLKRKTLASILKQAQLTPTEFSALL